MSEVHGRNIRALAQAAEADRGRHDALHDRVRHLEAVTAMQGKAISELSQQLNALLASRGGGPTAR